METFSNAVSEDIIPILSNFLLASRQAIENEIGSAALLFSLAFLCSILARSTLLFVPTATLALFALLSTDASTNSDRVVPLVIGTLALAVLCAWTLAIRRRFSMLKHRLKMSMDDHIATKKLLDRELTWRQAAEDEKLA